MTLALMRQFTRVQAVEEDQERVGDLRHNITVLLNAHLPPRAHTPAHPSTPAQASVAQAPGGGGGSGTHVLAHKAEERYGRVWSYCGDYVALACRLRQDVVVLDPPWVCFPSPPSLLPLPRSLAV